MHVFFQIISGVCDTWFRVNILQWVNHLLENKVAGSSHHYFTTEKQTWMKKKNQHIRGGSDLFTQRAVTQVRPLWQEEGSSGPETCGHLDKTWEDTWWCDIWGGSIHKTFYKPFILNASLLSYHCAPPRGGSGPSAGTFCRCQCFLPPVGVFPGWSSDSDPPPAAGPSREICRKGAPGWRRCPQGPHEH